MSIETDYAESAAKALRHLAGRYSIRDTEQTLVNGDERDWRCVWMIDAPSDLPVREIILAIPKTFPVIFPSIFIQGNVDGIAHLDSKGELCTFSRTEAFPNIDKPGAVAERVVEKAFELLRRDIGSIPRAEYLDEFQAYWRSGGSSIETISIINPGPPHRRIVQVDLSSLLGKYKYLFAESKEQVRTFLNNIGINNPRLNMISALYLHELTIDMPLAMSCNRDVYDQLLKHGNPSDTLIQFLAHDERPSVVLFSIATSSESVLGGWIHRQYGFDVNQGDGKPNTRVHNQARGFRPGCLSPRDELTTINGGGNIQRFSVVRADQARLISRTSGANCVVPHFKTINLIGCGSVGGFFLQSIAEHGGATVKLVDKENLEPHNVPRHICTMSHVGRGKALAVASVIGDRYPHLVLDPIDDEIMNVLRMSEDRLDGADFTIIAVTDIAIEHHLNRLGRSNRFGKLCFAWVEPFVLGGHLLIVDPTSEGGCFECVFTENGSFSRSVILNANGLIRRDPGCGGGFTPYGSGDLQRFTLAVAPEMSRLIEVPGSYLISYVGDLTRAGDIGAVIRAEYQAAQPFSIRTETISALPSCAACGK